MNINQLWAISKHGTCADQTEIGKNRLPVIYEDFNIYFLLIGITIKQIKINKVI